MPVDSTQDTPIWLAHVERTVSTTSPLIGPWVGWRAAGAVAMALIHTRLWGRRERERERNAGRVMLLGLLSVSDLSLHMLALKLYFPSQSGKHTKTTWQCSFFIFRLNWTSFSLSFSVAADYDVHSLLSAWLWLASNQWPALYCDCPCSRSPDHSTAHHCSFFFPRQWPVSSCLLFDFLLTLDKQNLTSVSGVGQSVQFTFNNLD